MTEYETAVLPEKHNEQSFAVVPQIFYVLFGSQ